MWVQQFFRFQDFPIQVELPAGIANLAAKWTDVPWKGLWFPFEGTPHCVWLTMLWGMLGVIAHCDRLPLRTLHFHLDLFKESGLVRAPHSSSSASVEVVKWLRSWNLQMELSEELKTAQGCSATSSPEWRPDGGFFFVSIEVGKFEDSPPLFPEELVEVVTVDHLEKEEMRHKSKLDECFLPSKSEPPRQGLPFFLDLHI